jgi:hypothetical protein
MEKLLTGKERERIAQGAKKNRKIAKREVSSRSDYFAISAPS